MELIFWDGLIALLEYLLNPSFYLGHQVAHQDGRAADVRQNRCRVIGEPHVLNLIDLLSRWNLRADRLWIDCQTAGQGGSNRQERSIETLNHELAMAGEEHDDRVVF